MRTWPPSRSPGLPGGTTPLTVAKSVLPDRANTATITGLTKGTPYTFTVRAVDNAAPTPNQSEEATIPLTPLASTAPVTVSFTGLPQDETIILSGTQDLSWTGNTALTVIVSDDLFTVYRWKLDGVEVSEADGSSLRGTA